ncbi:MAG: Integrase, catalytic region [Fibrobacteres bacterium]|nr:Integrase, catalytic region [Fibrobacterota bacterium]
MDFEYVHILIGQGYSRRKIAVMLGMSRNTLKKYLAPNAPRPDADGNGRPLGKLEPHLDILHRYLEADKRPRSIEAYRLLRDAGYSGGYDLVRKRVRDIRVMRLRESGPGELAPGQRAQVDMGRMRACGGTRYLFSMKLCHSERTFAVMAERPDLESFLDCHRQAFHFFRGAPKEIEYDAKHNKWLRRLVGGTRPNLPLARFAEHYGFAILDAPFLAPWAHGRLKRPLRMIQAAFLPAFPANGIRETNAAMLSWLAAKDVSRCGSSAEIRERYAREQASLRALPSDSPPVLRLKLRFQPAPAV